MTKTFVPIDGILLLDKPEGLSSNAVLQRVRRLFSAKKAGHAGTLDPLATGMLPICFGEATKCCQFLLDTDKCYEVTGVLGVKTTTADSTGEVISTTPDFSVTENMLRSALSLFLGNIQQIPSMYSAIKHQGSPLYVYARKGVTLERKARTVTIHDLDLFHFDGQTFHLRVTCSKGTYIRNLVEDIGNQLGVGAHVGQLHRCYTAGFENQSMHSLDELTEQSAAYRERCLLPIDSALIRMPRLNLKDTEVKRLRFGQHVSFDVAEQTSPGLYRLYAPHDVFVGIGQADASGELRVKRLLKF